MLGTELRTHRQNKGLTQAELASILDYVDKDGIANPSMIARMENGHAPINKRQEFALLYVFNHLKQRLNGLGDKHGGTNNR